MFVQFTKDVPGGDIKAKDVREFPDSVGRAYVDSGYGTETDAMTVLRAEQDARYKQLETSLTQAVSTALKPRGNPPVYRTRPDGSMDVEGIEGHTTAADKVTKIGPGDVVRYMYWRKAYGEDERITESMARHASQVLGDKRKVEQTQWTDNSEAHVTRDNPHGVTRDAAESTQGAPNLGYLVRPEFSTDMFRIEAETDVMTNLRQIPMGSGVEMHVPALDQYATSAQTRTSNYFGGVTLYRKPEDGARTATDTKVSEIEFKITDLTALTKVSRDLLADSFVDINGFLQNLFREAFGWRRDWDFLLGTGVGEPLGIWGPNNTEINGGPNSNARTTASHIRYEDVAWMMSKMLPQARRYAYWIVNAQAGVDLQAILAASPSAFAFQPNTLVSQAQWPSIYGTTAFDGVLLGLPVKYTEKAPALGTARDITLFCPKFYGEAQRSGLEVGISEHRYFENDQIGIRWKLRNDGKPMMRSTFKGYDGNTYSPIITLN